MAINLQNVNKKILQVSPFYQIIINRSGISCWILYDNIMSNVNNLNVLLSMQYKQPPFILDVTLSMNVAMFSCLVSSVNLSRVTHSLLERMRHLWLLLDLQQTPEDTLPSQVIRQDFLL